MPTPKRLLLAVTAVRLRVKPCLEAYLRIILSATDEMPRAKVNMGSAKLNMGTAMANMAGAMDNMTIWKGRKCYYSHCCPKGSAANEGYIFTTAVVSWNKPLLWLPRME